MEIIARSTAIFFFVWIVTRSIGKRQLSELSAFQLVLLITIGDLVQQGVTQDDRSVTGAFLAVGTIAFWVTIWSILAYFLPKSRRVIEGMPVIVIRDGHVIDEALRMERLPYDEVLEEARREGIEDVRDIKLAILETDGKFSFIKQDSSGDDDQESSADKRISAG
jgi:uncharacterized membrane protein YcaP (DUF421 family)